jgi:formylglycine-generating enzyme
MSDVGKSSATRTATLLVFIICGALVIANARQHRRSHDSAAHQSMDTMVQVAGSTITLGIDVNEIERFQKLFALSVRELFEEAVPRHKVRVRAFFIDKYLVTNSQFSEFTKEHPEWQPTKVSSQLDNGNYLKHWNGNSFRAAKANDPVVNINWYAAVAYCRAQNKRLPLEAEWEYAARGGLPAPLFPWGDRPASPRLANYSASGIRTTSPVGNYPANGYGLYDMAGNVWQFMADEWGKYPATEDDTQAMRTVADESPASFLNVRTRRVIRGGSFDGDPINLWLEYRDSHPPNGSQPFVGFRCAK